MEYAIARDLLSIGAVFLRPWEPFIWASGIKSPIYCDNRLVFSAPEVRSRVEEGLARLIRTHYPDCEIVMGTSTAGIGHAAIIGHLMGLPMGYVRGSAKGHGRENVIEGKLLPDQKTVVVEDLISTGGSVLDAVKSLQDAGARVLGIVSIFTYGMKKGINSLREAGVINHSLTNYDALLRAAVDEGIISAADIARLTAFRDNPDDESWMHDGKE